MLPDDDDAMLAWAELVPPRDPAEGLFARDSWLRRVSGDPVLIFGGGRALLLEVAHPLVAAGVAEHSDFRHDPFGRLQRTLEAMSAIVFRDRATALAAARSVERSHLRVRGTLARAAGPWATGTPYSGRDPDLMCWIWATLLDTALVVYQRFVAPLSEPALAAYHREQGALARLLGVPAQRVPDEPESFRRYLRGTLEGPALFVTDQAREIARAVLGAPAGPWGETANLLAVGLLPERLRADFGLTWDEARERELRTLEARVRAARAGAGAPVDGGGQAR
ncbi:MAG: oxygenase MpaB family protein [Myxococcota bacterium]